MINATAKNSKSYIHNKIPFYSHRASLNDATISSIDTTLIPQYFGGSSRQQITNNS